MKIKSLFLAIAATFGAAMMSTPATAAIYNYTVNGGAVLSINTDTNTGTFIGSDINATFTSADFATFAGGNPVTFMTNLATISGTRVINGNTVALNNGTGVHTPMLKIMGTTINLWATWGNPVQGGDYVRTVTGYSSTGGGTGVPEPGMIGLFGLGLAGLFVSTRRRRKVPASLRPAFA